MMLFTNCTWTESRAEDLSTGVGSPGVCSSTLVVLSSSGSHLTVVTPPTHRVSVFGERISTAFAVLAFDAPEMPTAAAV